MTFINELEYYLSCPVREITDSSVPYPVGQLVPDDKIHLPIRLNFQHYDNFTEAESKWNERAKRVNYNNIVYIFEFYHDRYDLNLLYEFDRISGKHIALLHKDIPNIKNKYVLHCYKEGEVAKIFDYDGWTGKRKLDEFDYTTFLNQ